MKIQKKKLTKLWKNKSEKGRQLTVEVKIC